VVSKTLAGKSARVVQFCQAALKLVQELKANDGKDVKLEHLPQAPARSLH
jgi:hypothetical protein